MKFYRHAFTMIELIFVIVIMGIIGKFGVEFLAQAYTSFIHSKVNNALQSNSESAIEVIAARLQNRIKDSVIARKGDGSFQSITDASGDEYKILEWVGSDIDGFRGNTLPFWSGIIDLNKSNKHALYSPKTNTTKINNLITILSHAHSNINDSALYFVGSNSNIRTGYGWNGNAIRDQNHTMHPIKADANISKFQPNGGTFKNINIYEYYKLAWTAYAVVYTPGTDNNGTLTLYYNFQPWQGEDYNTKRANIQHALIMQDVSTFRFISIGSIIKIQVCTRSNLLKNKNGDYSLCKEKTIF